MAELTNFQKDALNYKEHISLTANAGSGKTFVLSRRFLSIALETDAHISNIVAITFTEKAAGELYKKISETIETSIENEKDKTKLNKLVRLRRQLVSANISTIHSFCISILREFSPDAGIDANFTPIDPEISNELITRSIEDVLNAFIIKEETKGIVKDLIRLLGSKQTLAVQLKTLIDNRKKIEKLSQKIYSLDEQEIAVYFQNEFDRLFNKLFRNKIEKAIEAINRIVKNVLFENPTNADALTASELIHEYSDNLASMELLELFENIKSTVATKGGTIKIKGFLNKEQQSILFNEINYANEIFDECKSIKFNSNYNELNLSLASYGKQLIEIFSAAEDNYEELKKEKGYLDFEDLLIFTKNILVNPSVKERLQEKYKYIMIDEYQDTNEIQYDIFMPILEHLKTGNLFIVGDEKQSIYRFRDADLEVFNQTKNEIVKNSETENPKKLPHSFRLSPDIAFFTNLVFSKIFENPNPLFNEVNYDDLICANSPEEKGEIELLIADTEGTVQTEEELVAYKIGQMVQSGFCTFSEIAILCRKRDSFSKLENIFTKKNIPFKIIAGKGFFQRQVIYDIYQYLAFFVNPSDDIALAGILRSPFYSFSDKELFQISNSIGNSFFEKLKSSSEKLGKSKLVDLLISHLNFSKSAELNILIRRILLDTGYWFTVSAAQNADQEIANIEKLVGIANNYKEQSFKTLYDFVEKLKESLTSNDDEGQAIIPAEDDSVNILTIHKSKGLEFKAVFIFESHKLTNRTGIQSKKIEVDKDFGILTKVPENKNYFTSYSDIPINGIYNYLNAKRDLAEAKRLLYVAVTRAENYLAITGTTKKGKIANDSFLDLIAKSLELDLNAGEKRFTGKLQFMRGEKENFSIYESDKEITIKILNIIPDIEIQNENITNEEKGLNFLLESIMAEEKNEVLSATKLNVFLQCPLKYQLIYEIGYQKFINLFQNENYEEEYKLDESGEIPADMRGRVIHKILEMEIEPESLDNLLASFLDKELDVIDAQKIKKDEALSEFADILSKFYASNVYSQLKEYSNYKNEFELYLNEKDIFLYGVIDKLIFDDNKIIIADYKTDRVNDNSFDLKVKNYLNQLEFYAYLIKRNFDYSGPIELRLIFIRQPEMEFTKLLDSEKIEEFGKIIWNSVKDMRKGNYKKNLNHCRHCQFYSGSACVVK